VDLRLADLRTLLEGRKITLTLSDAARELVFQQGYDPNYGARPLKRAIQRLVQDPLAMKILDGEVLHGDQVLADADPKDPVLVFRVTQRTGSEATAEPTAAKSTAKKTARVA
jgi:ATP-dependent Clp protease ATP-binding subunit ClpB